MIRTLLSVLFLSFLAPSIASGAEPERIDGGRFGAVRYYEPPQGRQIEGVIAVVSDRGGWDAQVEALTRHLVDGGQVVLGIDLPVLLDALSRDKGDCSSISGDFEVVSRRVEKDLPFREFHPIVIIGIGAGSGIAYAAISEALPNTFDGGIGLGFTPAFDLGRKICLPTEPAQPGEKLRYAPVPDRETPWMFTPAPDFAASKANIDSFVSRMSDAHSMDSPPDMLATVDDALRQIPELNANETPISGLPIVELPPSDSGTGPHPLVVFYSGDGGWRDIDKQIGTYLSERGFFVVGFDSLRYFWREKEPKEMAADLDVLLRHYTPQWKGTGVVLIGYSFGADLLPFIVNRMAPDLRKEIKLISLLGISERASFEIRLEGILGASNTDGPLTLPELVRIKNIPIQCVYGFDETDSVCTAKELDRIVDRVELSGGHHFDGDYHHITDLIIAAAKPRLGK